MTGSSPQRPEPSGHGDESLRIGHTVHVQPRRRDTCGLDPDPGLDLSSYLPEE